MVTLFAPTVYICTFYLCLIWKVSTINFIKGRQTAARESNVTLNSKICDHNAVNIFKKIVVRSIAVKLTIKLLIYKILIASSYSITFFVLNSIFCILLQIFLKN